MKRQKSRLRPVILILTLSVGMLAVILSLAGLYAPADAGDLREEESIERQIQIPASRGEIYDRNGRPLTANRVKYTLVFDYPNFISGSQCALIDRVLSLLAEHEFDYADSFPVSAAPFSYTFTEGDRDCGRMAEFLKYRGLSEKLNAQEAVVSLCASYDIPARFSPDRARQILGVFYEMYRHDFSSLTPFVMLEGIGSDIISEISVNSDSYRGVTVGTAYERIYETELCAHILGRVGAIPEETLADYLEKGYGRDDAVGLDGAERAFEAELRGKNGVLTAQTDKEGNILSVVSETAPSSGSNVFLTIDLPVQSAAESALAQRISALRASGGEAAGGAAVVLDVDTGEVLALASYPTFFLSDFHEQYSVLLDDPLKPMFNRAIAGTYAPGSTFKMISATAALGKGIISPDTVIDCEGVYSYYAPDYLYHCWLYTDTGKGPGPLTVSGALAGSCNCFFYEVGRLCGIDLLESYARRFGLGAKTGIELGGEAEGAVASKSARQKRGEGFYAGDTLQAAIGQSDTLVTPLQLAAYVSQIVSGGKRYDPHVLLRTEKADTGAVIFEKKPCLAGSIEYRKKDLAAIRDGMLAVTSDGTARSVFEDYPVAVLGKSGSAQTASGAANAIFVLAAPADEPEIVISVVVEHGTAGNNAALVARDILDTYLSEKDNG